MSGDGCIGGGKAGRPDNRIAGYPGIRKHRRFSLNMSTKTPLTKLVLYLLGSLVLVLGITLVLAWWRDVVVLFRGVAGIGLALAGLLVLYSLKK